MRLRNIPEAKDVIEQYPDLVQMLTYERLEKESFHLLDFFPRPSQPLHLELGMGRGKFITTLAASNPEINYLGVEKYTSVVYKALLKIKDNPLTNLRLLVMDVNHLTKIFSGQEVDRIYLNFSDPWPSAGKAKQRLTHYNKLMLYKKFLKLGGEIHFKTDNEKLFEFSLNQFALADFKLKNITFDLHHSDFQGNVMTEYEERFSRLGKNIYRLEAQYIR